MLLCLFHVLGAEDLLLSKMLPFYRKLVGIQTGTSSYFAPVEVDTDLRIGCH